MLSISPKELVQLLETAPDTIELIDVRGTGEYDESHIPEAHNIPLHILPIRLPEINTQKQVVFICQSGGRSAQACMFLEQSGIKGYNLTGGMSAFESEFPQKVTFGEKKKRFGLF